MLHLGKSLSTLPQLPESKIRYFLTIGKDDPRNIFTIIIAFMPHDFNKDMNMPLGAWCNDRVIGGFSIAPQFDSRLKHARVLFDRKYYEK